MPHNVRLYFVMIASPGDVQQERDLIRKIVHEWNSANAISRKIVLMPLGWETDSVPEMGGHPQDIISGQLLKQADLLIGAFWSRIGTPTGKAISGSVEEIEEHIASGKPVMLYFSNIPIPQHMINNDQFTKLQEFKKLCQSNGLIEPYNSLDEFKDKLNRQLTAKINNHDYFKFDYGDLERETTRTVSISDKAALMLREMSLDQSGYLNAQKFLGGRFMNTNGKSLLDPENHSARELAEWESAISELEDLGLIKDINFERESFKITAKGYEAADQLKK